jgi:hypothetical protein
MKGVLGVPLRGTPGKDSLITDETNYEQHILAQLDVPLRVQPGLVCVVAEVPVCNFCTADGHFDFATTFGSWANGCLRHYLMHRASTKLGVGSAQLWINESQVGMTHLPRG